jgi:deoxyribodipyrimidine photo-lyase
MVFMNNTIAKTEISVFWFRRDLRLEDNTGLIEAVKKGLPVLPLFIFDSEITDSLPRNDARISFIYSCLEKINDALKATGSSLLIEKGNSKQVWKRLLASYNIKNVFFNKDYEPYAIARDNELSKLLEPYNIATYGYKDQVVFEENEILKADGKPYTVYTPYKNKWLQAFEVMPPNAMAGTNLNPDSFFKFEAPFPTLKSIGFLMSDQKVLPYTLDNLSNYEANRDYPSVHGTSSLSPHLRFGTLSIRALVNKAKKYKCSVFE